MTAGVQPDHNLGVRLAAVVLACAGLVACDLNLPSEKNVEDLRILDVQVDPPELALFARGSLELDPMSPPPFERTEVRVRALVAHPDLDASYGYRWVRCRPGLGSVPCEAGETREVLGSSTDATFSFVPVDLVLADVVAGEAPLESLAQRFVEDPRDLLNGLYAYINLEASVAQASITVDTQVIEAVKRTVIFEPRLVARAIAEAQKLDPSQVPMIDGLSLPSLCTQVSPAQAESLYTYLSTRTPNRAPTYQAIEIRVVGTPTTAIRNVALGEVLELEPGDVVRFRGVAALGDAEAYRLIDADCQLQDFQERLAYSWFTQAGELERNVSTDEDPVNSWAAPPASELPDSGELRARIWTVLRDGRGGSDHRWFDVHVRSAR